MREVKDEDKGIDELIEEDFKEKIAKYEAIINEELLVDDLQVKR